MSSLSELTEAFSDMVAAVRTYATKAYGGLEWNNPPEWFAPQTGEDGSSSIDLRRPATLAAAFDRTDIHDLMLKILAQDTEAPADALQPENVASSVSRGTAMDLATIQSQLEFLQAAERGYFNATMGYCRAAAHAAARHEAHGVSGGVLDRGIETVVANMKKRAAGA